MSEKNPGFYLLHDRWSTGTKGMTPAQKGCYIDLLLFQAEFSFLPANDPDTLMMICGVVDRQEWGRIWNQGVKPLKSKFEEFEEGKIANKRLKEDLEKEERQRKSRSENGKKGGRPKANQKAKPKAKQKLPESTKTKTYTDSATGVVVSTPSGESVSQSADAETAPSALHTPKIDKIPQEKSTIDPISDEFPLHPPPRSSAAHEHWGRFWEAWPVKAKEEPSFRAFCRASQRAEPSEIVAAAESMREAWRGASPIELRRCPMAVSWLDDGRWTDDPSTMGPIRSERRTDRRAARNRQAVANVVAVLGGET